MIIAESVIQGNPRFFGFLERFHCLTREGSNVKINGGTVIAGAALVVTLIGSAYALVIVPLQQDILRLELKHTADIVDLDIRTRAGEISDARTGVHLQALTKSIDRLVDKIEVAR